MSIWDLTIPNLVGYLAVGWAAVRALSHAFAVQECRRRLSEAEAAFDRVIGPHLDPHLWAQGGRDRRETVCALLRTLPGSHPSAVLLARSFQEHQLVQDDLAVQSWIGQAVRDQLGDLYMRMERLRSIAPVVGISGTISGFLIGTWTFGQTQDHAALMTSVAMALVTTLVAGLVVLLERWLLEGTLKPLHQHVGLHAQTVVAQARVLLRDPAVSPAEPESPLGAETDVCLSLPAQEQGEGLVFPQQ